MESCNLVHREIRLILLWCLPRNQNALRKPPLHTGHTDDIIFPRWSHLLVNGRCKLATMAPCLAAFFSGVALPLPALPTVSWIQLGHSPFAVRRSFWACVSALLTRSKALPYPQIRASFSLQNACLIYRIENTQHFLKRKVCLCNHFKRFF